jgi:hypothetical protein
MAYTPQLASKQAYQKQVFRSRLYDGKVGLFEMLRHWFAVRKIVKNRG